MSNQALPAPVPPEKSDVLDVIDYEIERLNAESRRPGWTKWALLASLGAVLWLLVGQLVPQPPATREVVAVFGAFIVAHSAIACWLQLLNVEPSSALSEKRFFWMHQFYQGRRPLVCADGLRAGIVFCATLILWNSISGLVGWSVAIASGFVVLGSLVVLAMSFDRSKIMAEQVVQERFFRVTCLVLLVVSISVTIAAIEMVPAALELPTDNRASVVRVAGLLFGASVVLKLYATDGRHSTLLELLLRVRRQLAFGHIDPLAALRHAESIVHGHRTVDVLMKHLAPANRCLHGMERAVATAESLFATLSSDVLPETGVATKAQRMAFESVASRITSAFAEFDRLQGLFESEMERVEEPLDKLIRSGGDSAIVRQWQSHLLGRDAAMDVKREALADQLHCAAERIAKS